MNPVWILVGVLGGIGTFFAVSALVAADEPKKGDDIFGVVDKEIMHLTFTKGMGE